MYLAKVVLTEMTMGWKIARCVTVSSSFTENLVMSYPLSKLISILHHTCNYILFDRGTIPLQGDDTITGGGVRYYYRGAIPFRTASVKYSY